MFVGERTMSKKDLVIVGIGASAGGLEALQAFVKNLPDNTNMAYIIAQHLSPTYKSMMVDLLAKDTDHAVLEAQNGLKPKPDTIYICPPNKNISIQNGLIALKEPAAAFYSPKPSVDIFFESLASEMQERAVGIILSGTGSDGARGARAIKAEGGYVLAQDPQSAKYDGMPISAINTGNIDLILPPEMIGPELIELLSYPSQAIDQHTEKVFTNIYNNILAKLYDVKGVDFSVYKPSTIQRRIERRMAALKIVNLTDYHNFLTNNTEEVDALFKDILIGVTSFFRDYKAFDSLKEQLQKIVAEKEGHYIRIWAPGCSTGEEAYSIAILLSHIIGEDIGKYKIQIFATDIDEDALAFARKGIYPESALMEIEKSIRNKFFLTRSDHFEIIKPIREMVIFSRHDIIKDPAFLRLDLIVCRNLLIYFSQELQKRLFPTFHYSLNDHGLLFLGKSESVGNYSNFFKVIDKKWKIFKANYLGRKEPPSANISFDLINMREKSIPKIKKPSLEEKVHDFVAEKIVPMCIVINDNKDIVYVKGKNPYLIDPEGEPTTNIFRKVTPALSIELRAIIHQCLKTHDTIKSSFQKVLLLDDIIRFVRMIAMPMEASEDTLVMICFQEEDTENFKNYEIGTLSGDLEITKQLELELARTKEHLQTVIEELETSNEEMQSLNEELQSSNEELQSSNEELETTNEELQSTNEELQTAYTELRTMYDEKEEHSSALLMYKDRIDKANQRLETALNAVEMGIFDHHIPVVQEDYWSELWAKILGYELGELPAERSNMSNWLRERVHPDDLSCVDDKHNAFNSGKMKSYHVQKRLKHKNGTWIWVESYAVAVQTDSDSTVSRVIGTMRDITREITQLQKFEELTRKCEQAQRIASMGNWEWDIATNAITWSKQIYEIFGIDLHTPITYDLFLSSVHKEDRQSVSESVKTALETLGGYEVTHRIIHPTKGIAYVQELGEVICDAYDRPEKMIGLVRDITKETNVARELKKLNERYSEAQRISKVGSWEWDMISDTMWLSEALYRIIDVDPQEEISLQKLHAMIHPDDLAKFQEDIKRAIEGKSDHNLIFRLITNGHTRTMHGRGVVEYDTQGNPIKMHGTGQDISAYQKGA